MDCRDTDNGILIPYLFFMIMKDIVGWKLYYADGNIVDSSQMKFDDAPPGGVQVFAIWYVDNKVYSVDIHHSYHTYAFKDSEVKIGHNIREGRFKELLNIESIDKVPVITMVK